LAFSSVIKFLMVMGLHPTCRLKYQHILVHCT